MRRAGLDGLRGVSCLAVVAHHYGARGARGGWLGVDAFFVLSGFLITRLLRDEQARAGTISVRHFWVRRAGRLAPALLCTLALVIATGQLTSWAAAAACLASVANVYRDSGGDLGALTPTWTLSVEEQFYLLWPLVIVLVRRRRHLLLLCTVAGAGSFILALLDLSPARRSYPHVHAWELLAGCLLALLPPGRVTRPRLCDLGVGVALVAVIVGNVAPDTPPTGTLLSAAVVGGSAAFIAWDGAGSLAGRLMRVPALAWVGRVSYPAYLLHVPLWLLITPHLPAVVTLRCLVLLPTVLVVSGLVHHLVERPVQRAVRARPAGAPHAVLPVPALRADPSVVT